MNLGAKTSYPIILLPPSRETISREWRKAVVSCGLEAIETRI
jgi:hypothetical protein